jgi:hypothetical protein
MFDNDDVDETAALDAAVKEPTDEERALLLLYDEDFERWLGECGIEITGQGDLDSLMVRQPVPFVLFLHDIYQGYVQGAKAQAEQERVAAEQRAAEEQRKVAAREEQRAEQDRQRAAVQAAQDRQRAQWAAILADPAQRDGDLRAVAIWRHLSPSSVRLNLVPGPLADALAAAGKALATDIATREQAITAARAEFARTRIERKVAGLPPVVIPEPLALYVDVEPVARWLTAHADAIAWLTIGNWQERVQEDEDGKRERVTTFDRPSWYIDLRRAVARWRVARMVDALPNGRADAVAVLTGETPEWGYIRENPKWAAEIEDAATAFDAETTTPRPFEEPVTDQPAPDPKLADQLLDFVEKYVEKKGRGPSRRLIGRKVTGRSQNVTANLKWLTRPGGPLERERGSGKQGDEYTLADR